MVMAAPTPTPVAADAVAVTPFEEEQLAPTFSCSFCEGGGDVAKRLGVASDEGIP
jgi:hypothetical protein